MGKILVFPHFPPAGLRRGETPALYSVVKSFSGLTFFWKGAERSVAVVPGWSATAITWSRLISFAMFLVAMFSALFDMRYDHHPPILLSPIEPTRADRLAMTAPLDRRGWTA